MSSHVMTAIWVTLKERARSQRQNKSPFCSYLGQMSMSKLKRTKKLMWDHISRKLMMTQDSAYLHQVTQLQHQPRVQRGSKQTFGYSETPLAPFTSTPLFLQPQSRSLSPPNPRPTLFPFFSPKEGDTPLRRNNPIYLKGNRV